MLRYTFILVALTSVLALQACQTKPSFQVATHGMHQGVVPIFFPKDNDTMGGPAKATLDRIAQNFIQFGGKQINLVGFAEDKTKADPKAEAQAYERIVRDYLVARGVPEAAIVTGKPYREQDSQGVLVLESSPALRRVEVEIH